jgi:uncharacterized protein YdbL (DUF1318 family)
MVRRVSRLLLGALAVSLFLSCVTVNIYFPAAQAQKTAREIVEDVRGVKVEKQESPHSLWVGVAYAGEEALEVSNATIRALKESIKKRYSKLEPYLARGVLGEGLDGYLVLKDEEGLTLKEKVLVRRLMKAENDDRKALYQAVAQALGVDDSQLPRLRRIFAREWQRTAPPGTWIEEKPGEWKRK